MSILSRLFSRQSGRDALVPLYSAIVEEARNPCWYQDGAVADTLDGRFDMVASLLSMTLVRLEREGQAEAAHTALLTEIFIEDMDGQLRQMGIGDVVVGKHIGRMMSALGGRLSAYREGFSGSQPLEDALSRNLYRGEVPSAEALAFSAARMRLIAQRLDETSLPALLQGEFPGG